ncbi:MULTISPECIES: outer membrane beta-barrel protein [Sulfurimonas]|uniref:outer membrane protein n=1 Tax=Sulfurimonas TaxID=202746 RepID=UPI00126479C3|nr:outer membrane beta-barrel protein [Sulfurimonas indica]
MKKIILLLLLITSLLNAESKIYFGAGYAYNSETITYGEDDWTIDNNAAQIKVGYGDRKAYAVELSFDYVDNNSRIFDSNDGKKYGFNVELLKAWDFGIYVNPYLKAGFGGGYLETPADLHNGSLTYGSFNLGAGFFIPISEHFDLELAYEYKNISYQKLDLNSTLTPSSHLNIGYVGINFRF